MFCVWVEAQNPDNSFEIKETTKDGNDAINCPPVSESEPRADRAIIRWLSEEDDDDDDFEYPPEARGGMQEPPATPIAKDELALRRYRFFSDLIDATKNSSEHRVRFDPLGPLIHPG